MEHSSSGFEVDSVASGVVSSVIEEPRLASCSEVGSRTIGSRAGSRSLADGILQNSLLRLWRVLAGKEEENQAEAESDSK